MVYHILSQEDGEFIGMATTSIMPSTLTIDVMDGELVTIPTNGMHIDNMGNVIVALVVEHTGLFPDDIYLTDEQESEILFAL